MLERPVWFTACIIATVFSTVLLAASSHVGFFIFLLNLACVAMFVVPMVDAVKKGEVT